MVEFWGALSGVEQVFYIIAIVSSAILVVQFILNLMGLAGDELDFDTDLDVVGDFDGDVEVSDFDIQDGLGIFSIRTILAFLVGFGWTGVVTLNMNIPLFISILIALLVGVVFMLVVFWLMRLIYGLSESGNIRIENAVGATGKVYLPVAAKGTGVGQVQVVVQGRLRELPAVTDMDEALATGTPIRVVKMLDDDTLVVRRVVVE
ncbi:MAG: hypothetical protein JW981_00625 [Anaerolineae bacterium]|nr:hypothetical protein [Anaerolineae bacterium]